MRASITDGEKAYVNECLNEAWVAHDIICSEQCDKQLREMRSKAEVPSVAGRTFRGIIRRSGLGGIPKLGKHARSAFGYKGIRIARLNPGSSECDWTQQEYRFL